MWGASTEEEGCRYVVAAPTGDAVHVGGEPRKTVSLWAAGLLAGVSALLGAGVSRGLLTAPLGAVPGAAFAPADVLAELPPLSQESEQTARRTEHLFGELTTEEVRAVASFAAAKLGCATRYRGTSGDPLRGCLLMGSEAVTLKLPSKAAALAHLDAGAEAPPRMAEVIVTHGDKPAEEGVGIYSVGPLNGRGGLSKNAEIKLVRSHHWNRRPLDMADNSNALPITRVVKMHKDILVASFGPVFPQLGEEGYDPEAGVTFNLISPAVSSCLKQRVSRAVFNWYKDPEQFQISWMHTLPYNFEIVHDGQPEDWPVVNVTYCGQFFATPEAMLEADKNGTLVRCSSRPETSYGWDAAGPDPNTAAGRAVPPPGPRAPKTWQVLGRGGIRWGDWELFATVRPGTGLALHDVRFRGERVLYEMGLSDAHAYYATELPEKQFHYSDKAFSLSQISGSLVEGLDCPHGASFLEATSWILASRKNGVVSDPADAKTLFLACVFESSGTDGSLWRHAQLYSRQVTGRRKRMLVLRHVSTVGNYDYVSEVHLLEDGAIHARNEFAGYPETDKSAPFRDPIARVRRIVDSDGGESSFTNWGSHVRGDVVAQMHSHFCVWKVDLDIFGTSNEFHTVKSVVQPGSDTALPVKRQVARRVEKEDPDETFIASAHAPQVWRIVNPEAQNPVTGSPRGYAVVIETAPAIQTLPRDHPYSVTGTFARRHLTVTQRKEEEPAAVHSLDHYPITEPLLSVEKFLSDRESLLGEDLVCWVSIGKEHITRSEDVPLVSNFGVQFALIPWNYHEENPAMQLPMTSGPRWL